MGCEKEKKYSKMHEVNVFLDRRDDSILNLTRTRSICVSY